MSHDALPLVPLIHRLAAVDRFARARVARLLCIRDNQAAVLLSIADGRAIGLDELAAAFEMSLGGARAFAHWLEIEALVRPEPVPPHQSGIALRLAPGAGTELAAALAPITDRLEPIAGAATTQLAAVLEALDELRPVDE
jgi:hypothetical protein